MTLSRDTQIDRTLTVAVVSGLLAIQLTVLYGAYIAARMEFTHGVRSVRLQRQGIGESTPALTVMYRSAYPYSWWWLAVSVAWAGWISRRRCCSLLTLVWYIGVCLELVVFWLMFTLLALYLGNQEFYT